MKKSIVIFIVIILSGCSIYSNLHNENTDINNHYLEHNIISTDKDNYNLMENLDNNYSIDNVNQILNKVGIINTENVIYFEKTDMNKDNINEIIIAVGNEGEELLDTYISNIYLLSFKNNELFLIKSINDCSYSIYDVDLIKLRNQKNKYLLCRLTNGKLKGFCLYEYIDKDIKSILYSASATGVGEDKLIDSDNDGEFDGYYQHRWSYDVLYYNITKEYIWNDEVFELKTIKVDIPVIPTNPEEVVFQLLSLMYIVNSQDISVPEVEERLLKICPTYKAYEFKDIDYNLLLNTILLTDDKIDFITNISNNKAQVIASFNNEQGVPIKYIFNLKKLDNKWIIDNIDL